MKYLWHIGVSRWEEIMERIPDVKKTIKQVHEKFLGKRNRVGRGVVHKRKKMV